MPATTTSAAARSSSSSLACSADGRVHESTCPSIFVLFRLAKKAHGERVPVSRLSTTLIKPSIPQPTGVARNNHLLHSWDHSAPTAWLVAARTCLQRLGFKPSLFARPNWGLKPVLSTYDPDQRRAAPRSLTKRRGCRRPFTPAAGRGGGGGVGVAAVICRPRVPNRIGGAAADPSADPPTGANWCHSLVRLIVR